jgi:rSAM/selenodomain-associated transferase 1
MNALIVFAKNLKLGTLKTRLAKTFGNKRAMEVYKKLLEQTLKVTENLTVEKNIFYSTEIEEGSIFNASNYKQHIQHTGDLGNRMSMAFKKLFSEGKKSVIIIGSDCYDLDQETIEKAFLKLKTNDIVLGPAEDGGYYLLGMNSYYPWLFEGKNWSTESLFTETTNEIKQQEKTLYKLQTLNDVDTEEDLPKELR